MRRGTPFSSVTSSLSLFFVFLSSLLPAVLFPQFHWILKKYISTTITGPQSAPQGWLSWVACTHETHRRAYTQTRADACTNTLTQTRPVSESSSCGKDTTIFECLFAVVFPLSLTVMSAMTACSLLVFFFFFFGRLQTNFKSAVFKVSESSLASQNWIYLYIYQQHYIVNNSIYPMHFVHTQLV